VPWYGRVHGAIQAALPNLVPTQATNLALLVSAILAKRTLCLSELARAYPTPARRRVAAPEHDLLHRLKRRWRCTANPRLDAQAGQPALIPHPVARLGRPRWLGLAVDWTLFDARLPSGRRLHYQVLRLAVPRRGRALPLLRLASDNRRRPAGRSQNQLEAAALLAVVRALPDGVRPVVLADRGVARATFFAWLQRHGLDSVVRTDKGTCLTAADGRRRKLGQEGLARGEVRWAPRCAPAGTTTAPAIRGATSPWAGACPPGTPGTRGARRPRPRGTSPPAAPTRPRRRPGSGSGAGASNASRTARAASGSPPCRSAARRASAGSTPP
jgi:hypothetical protein